MRTTLPRRTWRMLGVLFFVALLARPASYVFATLWSDRSDRRAVPAGRLDDASALNETAVLGTVAVAEDAAAAERQIAGLVDRAAREHRQISIAGARHSMGGHTLTPDGLVLDMRPLRRMELDERRDVLRVQAGALWSEVLPFLNARGRSVAVMQSNNSFTVGGSISVNCHGWPANRPPIASTVESMRIAQPDGRVVVCNRMQNAELFAHALGGYGLFGVILEAELHVVPNEAYRLQRFEMAVSDYAAAYDREVLRDSRVGMAYGRLSVSPDGFLDQALLSVYRRIPGESGRPSAVAFPEVPALTRLLLRGQAGSEYGKRLRWQAETRFGGLLGAQRIWRNELLSEPAEVFANRSEASTDILHEYFVPAAELGRFASRLREIVPRHRGDLLNVTIRHVLRDDDTTLRYADQDLFALVMLFNQRRTPEGEAAMRAMTVDLIEAALDSGGRYYLPYRLHANHEQFLRAYPQADAFFAAKRRYDPGEIFANAFYSTYGPQR
jgi:FAD/FMN-containing dehydrogenase